MNDVLTDDYAIRERLKEIISSHSEFEPSGKYKFRDIQLQEPDYHIYDGPAPYCFIKLPEDYQYTNYTFGSAIDGAFQQIAKYEIGVIVHSADIRRVQPEINRRVNIIREILRKNRTLRDSANQNPLVVRSVVKAIKRINSDGSEIDGAIMELEVQIGAAWSVEISYRGEKLAEIDALSFPQQKREPVKQSFNQEDATVEKGVIAYGGVFDVEFEADEQIESILDGLSESDRKYTILLKRDGISTKRITATIDAVGIVYPYDNVARRVMTANIVGGK